MILSKTQRKTLSSIIVILILSLGVRLYFQYLKPRVPDKTSSEWVKIYEAGQKQPDPSALNQLVHIGGEVQKPGMYEIKPGSRIYDAIQVAGGFTSQANPDKLNLAKIVKDGDQIKVPTRKHSPNSTMKHNLIPSEKISINHASVAELCAVPGVGPSLATRIIDYREQNGPFSNPKELLSVKGIGQNLLQKISPHIQFK